MKREVNPEMPTPSFGAYKEAADDANDCAARALHNHENSHPPSSLMEEEEIGNNCIGQCFRRTSGERAKNTSSHQTLEGLGRAAPNSRGEKDPRRNNEHGSSTNIHSQWNPKEVLSSTQNPILRAIPPDQLSRRPS